MIKNISINRNLGQVWFFESQEKKYKKLKSIVILKLRERGSRNEKKT